MPCNVSFSEGSKTLNHYFNFIW